MGASLKGGRIIVLFAAVCSRAVRSRNPYRDIDFSPPGIMRRWDACYAHTKAALDRSPWTGQFDLHEQMELMPGAAE